MYTSLASIETLAFPLKADKTCKCILREDNKRDKYAVNNPPISIQKEDAHIQRDIENKLIFHNVWHYYKVYQI